MRKRLESIGIWLGPFSALASILSLILSYNSQDKDFILHVILIWIIVTTICTLGIMIYGVNKLIKTSYPDDHLIKFIYINFTSETRTHAIYNNYKHIQCKRLIKYSFDHDFKWSTPNRPIVSSNLQTIEKESFSNNRDTLDTVTLRFKEPLYFNDTEIVHFKAEVNDADKAIPMVAARIKHKTQIVHFVVELRYKGKNYNSNAIIERRKTDSPVLAWIEIDNVSFDSFKYEYFLLTPEIGFSYRMRWEH